MLDSNGRALPAAVAAVVGVAILLGSSWAPVETCDDDGCQRSMTLDVSPATLALTLVLASLVYAAVRALRRRTAG
jgi:hypothetical protein